MHRHSVAPAHAARDLRQLERHFFPALGAQPIADIAPRQLLEVLRQIKRMGYVETAHRVQVLCSQVFRFAL